MICVKKMIMVFILGSTSNVRTIDPAYTSGAIGGLISGICIVSGIVLNSWLSGSSAKPKDIQPAVLSPDQQEIDSIMIASIRRIENTQSDYNTFNELNRLDDERSYTEANYKSFLDCLKLTRPGEPLSGYNFCHEHIQLAAPRKKVIKNDDDQK